MNRMKKDFTKEITFMTKKSHLYKETGYVYKKHYFYSLQLYMNQMSDKYK